MVSLGAFQLTGLVNKHQALFAVSVWILHTRCLHHLQEGRLKGSFLLQVLADPHHPSSYQRSAWCAGECSTVNTDIPLFTPIHHTFAVSLLCTTHFAASEYRHQQDRFPALGNNPMSGLTDRCRSFNTILQHYKGISRRMDQISKHYAWRNQRKFLEKAVRAGTKACTASS